MRALQLPLVNADADGRASWMADEVLGCEFPDRRLGRRFKIVLKQLSEASCESIPLACQDWAVGERQSSVSLLCQQPCERGRHPVGAHPLDQRAVYRRGRDNPDPLRHDRVHIGDHEANIYELFCAANDVGTHFLVRTCVGRVAKDGTTRTDFAMEQAEVKGLHRIEVRDRDGEVSEAVLEIKYQRMLVLSPVAKARDYGPLALAVIHATERGTPKNRERIEWKLLTDLPVRSRQEAIEKLRWYALRWKIELFHKILKSGCKVEESRLRRAPRLVNLIATCCVLAWRIF